MTVAGFCRNAAYVSAAVAFSAAAFAIVRAQVPFFQILTNSAKVTSEAADPKSGLGATLRTLNDPKTGLAETVKELNASLREARKTIDVLQATSLVARDASSQEQAKLAEFSAEGVAAAKAANRAVVDLDEQVKHIGPAVDAIGSLASTLSAESTGTLRSGAGALDSLARTSESAGSIVRGPLTDAANSFKSTSGHIDESSAELQDTMGYIRDLFKPHKLSFWRNLLDKALGNMVSIALNFLFPERAVIR